MRHDPHKLVEGCLVAGRSMGAVAGNKQNENFTTIVCHPVISFFWCTRMNS